MADDERLEQRCARPQIDAPETCGLGECEGETWHFAVLTPDARQQSVDLVALRAATLPLLGTQVAVTCLVATVPVLMNSSC